MRRWAKRNEDGAVQHISPLMNHDSEGRIDSSGSEAQAPAPCLYVLNPARRPVLNSSLNSPSVIEFTATEEETAEMQRPTSGFSFPHVVKDGLVCSVFLR